MAPALEKSDIILNRHPWMASFITILMLYLVSYTTLGLPIHEVCDDLLMAMTAAGIGFHDKPDPHLIYSHYFIGWVLSSLYKLERHFPWYALYMLGSQILALTIIVRLLAKRFSSLLVVIPVALFLATSLRPVLYTQFTTTASLIATAAGMMMLYAFEHHKLKKTFRIYLTARIVGFVYASMMRSESALLMLAFTAVVQIIKEFPRLKISRFKFIVPALFITALSIFALKAGNEAIYRADPLWKDTYKQVSSTWTLINTDKIESKDEKTQKAFAESKLKVIDIYMLKTWCFIDKQFNYDRLMQLTNNISRINPGSSLRYISLIIWEYISDRTMIPYIVVILLCLFQFSSPKFSTSSGLILILVVCLVMASLIAFVKLPERVCASILLYTTAILLFFSSPLEYRRFLKIKTLMYSISAVLLITCSLSIYKHFENLKEAETKRVLVADFCDRMRKQGDKLIVLWAAAFPYKYISPLEDLDKYFHDLKLVGFNSMLPSPLFQARLEEFGIRNLLKELDRDDVLIVVDGFLKTVIEEYMIRNHQTRPIFKDVFKTPQLVSQLEKVTFSDNLIKPYSDLSKDSPGRSDKDLFLYPDRHPMIHQQIKLISKEGNLKNFEVTGRWPAFVFKFKKGALKPGDISHVFAELKVDKSNLFGRQLYFFARPFGEVKGKAGHVVAIADGKLHTYTYPIAEMNLDPDESIEEFSFFPLFKQLEFSGETFKVGRIGFILKNKTIMSDI